MNMYIYVYVYIYTPTSISPIQKSLKECSITFVNEKSNINWYEMKYYVLDTSSCIPCGNLQSKIFKVNNKNTKTTSLMSFWCFYC